MKKILSYLIMSLLFFNILFIFYYYFKIVTFLYIDLFDLHILANIVSVNLFIVCLDVIYLSLYSLLKLNRLSYFVVAAIGGLIGFFVSVLLLGLGDYELGDYLAIISYFIINTIFLSYSLYFDKEKINVFE